MTLHIVDDTSSSGEQMDGRVLKVEIGNYMFIVGYAKNE